MIDNADIIAQCFTDTRRSTTLANRRGRTRGGLLGEHVKRC